jgi:hypothetical protein
VSERERDVHQKERREEKREINAINEREKNTTIN